MSFSQILNLIGNPQNILYSLNKKGQPKTGAGSQECNIHEIPGVKGNRGVLLNIRLADPLTTESPHRGELLQIVTQGRQHTLTQQANPDLRMGQAVRRTIFHAPRPGFKQRFGLPDDVIRVAGKGKTIQHFIGD